MLCFLVSLSLSSIWSVHKKHQWAENRGFLIDADADMGEKRVLILGVFHFC